jgi:ketosteroid isomerase-like protein
MPTTTVLSEADADRFVATWMEAWNRHDLEAILDHYTDDVEYYSPFIAQLADPSGRLVGKEALRSYVAAALERFPDLHFDRPLHVAAGAGSVSFVYRSVNGLLAVETLVFAAGTPEPRVARAHCHYRAG